MIGRPIHLGLSSQSEVTMVSVFSESPLLSRLSEGLHIFLEEWDHMTSVSCFENSNTLRFICLFEQPNIYLFKRCNFINNYHGRCNCNNHRTGSVDYLPWSRWVECLWLFLNTLVIKLSRGTILKDSCFKHSQEVLRNAW